MNFHSSFIVEFGRQENGRENAFGSRRQHGRRERCEVFQRIHNARAERFAANGEQNAVVLRRRGSDSHGRRRQMTPRNLRMRNSQ